MQLDRIDMILFALLATTLLLMGMIALFAAAAV
jgi:hypothetical protein